MHPTQCSSLATYMGNHPRRFAVVRQAKTSTGQMFRQNPHALHMSSPRITSHFPAGPLDARFSSLNSAILLSLLQHPEDDRLRGRDVGARERLRPLGVTRHDGLEDRAVLAPPLFQPMPRT